MIICMIWCRFQISHFCLFVFRIKPNGRKIGGFFLLAATAGIAASAVDDVLVFQQCSK